ncbi:MAG: nucleotidyl transferase AbiEii/AbiGii toxin family protein, partial [Candidatus Rokuibacteriota bacterium]
SRLTSFQRDVVRAFFARERRFFLTGGGALVGFHLGHRETDDIDLFATTPILDEGRQALRAVAEGLGASIETLEDTPYRKVSFLRRGEESLKVELVLETVTQWFPEKRVIGGIVVDPAEEILANKLCTLLSRAEIRDLVDIFALEREGLRIEDAFPAATRKDGGLTPAQLAEVLSEWRLGADAPVPGGMSVAALDPYRRELIRRLTRMAFPGAP